MDYSLFHGTTLNNAERIVSEGIRLDQNYFMCDFGPGFYLSPDVSSAKTWASRKAFKGTPAIIELQLSRDYGKRLRVKDFSVITDTLPDELILSWAQFIINNRCGAEYMRGADLPEALCDNNLSGRYDIVVGQIADGDVTQIAQACKRETRPVTSDEARSMLSKNFGMQYCLCTNNALAEITKQPRIKEGVQWR